MFGTKLDNCVSTKAKLLKKLRSKPTNFTWEEAVALMGKCGFELVNRGGSRRLFRHSSGLKVSIHEPHPQNTLLKYALEILIDGLTISGEIKNETKRLNIKGIWVQPNLV